jgi:hypothetical protein
MVPYIIREIACVSGLPAARTDLLVSLGLQREQMGVVSGLLHELLVVAVLDDATVLDDDDLVGHAHR